MSQNHNFLYDSCIHFFIQIEYNKGQKIKSNFRMQRGNGVMETTENMILVLLAGQSNMAGRGEMEPEDREEIPGLKMINRELQWVPAVEPVTADRAFAGVGPGRTFGRLLLEANPGCTVGLVPVAVGGTPISAWKRGGTSPWDEKERPYDAAVLRAKAALKQGRFAAVLWHQGETDAKLKNLHYADDLKEVIRNFREDLPLSGVPFLCGELGHYLKGGPYDFPQIDADIRRVAAELPDLGWVSAEGLMHKGDGLHFSAASAREFGRRYFDKYIQMARQR